MSRILFAWELGSGTGHLHTLSSLIEPLLRLGHRVTVVSKSVHAARGVLGSLDVDLLPAPFWQGQAKGLAPAANYNEVLFHVGYLQPQDIEALVEAWRNLYRLVQADLLIAEHAPTALLAARVAALPALVVGTGFTLPPAHSPLPTLEPWAKPDLNRLKGGEQRALKCANQVLSSFDAPPLANMAELFQQRGSFLLTVPELDHYGERSGVRYWGHHLNQVRRLPAPLWPGGSMTKIFVYLHPGYRQFQGVVAQLRELKYRTLVVAPGMEQVWMDRMSNGRLKIISHQVDIGQVVKQCRLCINHASHGLMADLLRRGKPLLMLPNYTEQTVLAWRAAQQSLGVMASPDPARHRYRSMIEKMLDSRRYDDAAEAFAERYRADPLPHEALIEQLKYEIEAI